MPMIPHRARGASRPSKLDARLRLLLALSPEALAARQKKDVSKLRSRRERIRQLEEDLARETRKEKQERIQSQLAVQQRRQFSPSTTGVRLPTGAGGEVRFSALISFDGRPADFEADLKRRGAELRGRMGDIFSVLLPRSQVRGLAARRGVRWIELARAMHPDIRYAIGPAVTDLVSLHAVHQGTGVLIGVIDDALDIFHEAFRTEGDTRVVYLFDAVSGSEYRKAAIRDELQLPGLPYAIVQHDPGTRTHGTGVLGCAAIAAPKAALAFASCPPALPEAEFGETADVVIGLEKIFAFAHEQQLPCVVNISQSDNLGPHDGTTALEKAIDAALLQPGRAVTLSAGNSNEDETHVHGSVANTALLKLEYMERQETVPDADDALEIWYDGQDEFEVTVTVPADIPGGLEHPTLLGPVAPGSSAVFALANGVELRLISVLQDARNGDNVIRLEIDVPVEGRVPIGVWEIQLRAQRLVTSGIFHAWVDRNNVSLCRWTAPLPSHVTTIGCPSAAVSAITVGSHARTTRVVTGSSGMGPTRKNDLKPDLFTVGEGMKVPKAESRTIKAAGTGTVTRNGTSFAAPVVAGACALLFECLGANATASAIKTAMKTATAAMLPDAVAPGAGAGSLRMSAHVCPPAQTRAPAPTPTPAPAPVP